MSQRAAPSAPPRTLVEVSPGSHVFTIHGALPDDTCCEIIERFERASDEQYPGRIGQGAWFDDSVKRSTDLVISGKPHWHDMDRALFRSLGAAMNLLHARFPYFGSGFKDIGYAVQRTNPGEYYHWHIDGGSHDFSARQLVAIWYLNDVRESGGETEFRRQNLRIRPETGKLLLFPPFWTHEHRGVTLERGVKYIATTWVVFA